MTRDAFLPPVPPQKQKEVPAPLARPKPFPVAQEISVFPYSPQYPCPFWGKKWVFGSLPRVGTRWAFMSLPDSGFGRRGRVKAASPPKKGWIWGGTWAGGHRRARGKEGWFHPSTHPSFHNFWGPAAPPGELLCIPLLFRALTFPPVPPLTRVCPRNRLNSWRFGTALLRNRCSAPPGSSQETPDICVHTQIALYLPRTLCAPTRRKGWLRFGGSSGDRAPKKGGTGPSSHGKPPERSWSLQQTSLIGGDN